MEMSDFFFTIKRACSLNFHSFLVFMLLSFMNACGGGLNKKVTVEIEPLRISCFI